MKRIVLKDVIWLYNLFHSSPTFKSLDQQASKQFIGKTLFIDLEGRYPKQQRL